MDSSSDTESDYRPRKPRSALRHGCICTIIEHSDNIEEFKLALTMPKSDYVIGHSCAHRKDCLAFACRCGKLEFVKCYAAYYKPQNTVAWRNPMLTAAQYGHLDIVQYCLERGAGPNASDLLDNTALHFAALMGDLVLVRYLCEMWNANPSVTNRMGHTPLRWACGMVESDTFFMDVVAYLAPLTPKNDIIHILGVLLKWDKYARSDELFHYLLDQNVDINQPWNLDREWFNLILKACRRGRVHLVRDVFIPRGADIHYKTEDGWTAIHALCMLRSPNPDMLDFLLASGLNINAKTADGETPLDVAYRLYRLYDEAIDKRPLIDCLIYHGATCKGTDQPFFANTPMVDQQIAAIKLHEGLFYTDCLDNWIIGNIMSYVSGFHISRKDVHAVIRPR